jgi:hypothetical protein
MGYIHVCDRCGRPMPDWQLEGEHNKDVVGGNCCRCGDDLCSECAGECMARKQSNKIKLMGGDNGKTRKT